MSLEHSRPRVNSSIAKGSAERFSESSRIPTKTTASAQPHAAQALTAKSVRDVDDDGHEPETQPDALAALPLRDLVYGCDAQIDAAVCS